MKNQFKLLTLAASAAMMFTACSSDKLEAYAGQPDLNPEAPSNAIQFGTYMGKTGTTRATVGKTGAMNDTELQESEANGGGFGVFAYYTGNDTWSSVRSTTKPNFMYNQGVFYSSSIWGYSPVKYWPNDNTTADNIGATGTTTSKISFFAYAPYVGTITSPTDGIMALTANSETGDPKVTYKLPTTPLESNTVDLLWGMNGKASYNEADGTASTSTAIGTGYNVDLTKQTIGEKVNFLFKHALAKLGGSKTTNNKGGVYVALDLDNVRTTTGDGTNGGPVWDGTTNTTLVTISSIKIENGVSSGTGVLKDGGVFDLATGTWDVSSANDYTFTDQENTVGSGHLNAHIAEPASVSYSTTNKQWEKTANEKFEGVTTTLKEVYDAKSALYFVPTGADQKIKVTITYKVRTYDAKLEAGHTDIDQTISKVITFSLGFAKNSLYRLNIYLGLTSVKFTASVAAWGDEDGQTEADSTTPVDLPINVADPT